jgi:hypothetical protein
MNTIRNTRAFIAMGLTAAILAAAGSARAQSTNMPVVKPTKGQTAEQMEKDKNDCYGSAKKETGYDPVAAIAAQQQAQAAPTAPADQNKSGAVRGAAKGAAAGAAIGAIAGDAGKGAAIGATAGGAGGAIKKRRQEKEEDKQAAAQQQAEAQKQAAEKQKFDAYMKSFKACLEGKGYTVQ